MFWVTVSEGIRLNAWKTNPIRSRRRIVSRRSLSPASSVSPSATVPEVGRSSPAATWRIVLLPDPDGPMIAVNDPAREPDADAVERDDGAIALAVDLADVAKGDRGSAGGHASAGAFVSVAFLVENMRRVFRLSPRPSHPACLRPSLRALVPGGAASRTGGLCGSIRVGYAACSA